MNYLHKTLLGLASVAGFTGTNCSVQREADSPFFIYYPMVLPHDPFVPTPDSPEWADSYRQYEHDTVYFRDMIAYIDKIIGQLEAKLKEKGVWENTLLIFTADKGESKPYHAGKQPSFGHPSEARTKSK